MSEIWITNRSETVFQDGFAGVKYTFTPGEAVAIPLEAARHIFGFQSEDKTPFLARLGWARTTNDVPEGLKRLEAFQIDLEKPELKPAKAIKLVK